MNISIVCLFIVIAQIIGASSSSTPFELPKSWTKDFKFSIHDQGGMQDKATVCTYTYDSCEYVERVGRKKTIVSFPLTEAERVLILKKLHDLKVDKIRSSKNEELVRDQGTSMICFHSAKFHEYCLSDGSGESIHKDDMASFGSAYRFLMNYGKSKGKEKK